MATEPDMCALTCTRRTRVANDWGLTWVQPMGRPGKQSHVHAAQESSPQKIGGILWLSSLTNKYLCFVDMSLSLRFSHPASTSGQSKKVIASACQAGKDVHKHKWGMGILTHCFTHCLIKHIITIFPHFSHDHREADSASGSAEIAAAGAAPVPMAPSPEGCRCGESALSICVPYAMHMHRLEQGLDVLLHIRPSSVVRIDRAHQSQVFHWTCHLELR